MTTFILLNLCFVDIYEYKILALNHMFKKNLVSLKKNEDNLKYWQDFSYTYGFNPRIS